MNTSRDVALTALAPVIWGSTYLVTSEWLPPDRPFTTAFLRVLPAGVLLTLFTRHLPARADRWRLGVLAALNIWLFQALLFVAAYRLPGGLAAVLGAIQPLLVPLAWQPVPISGAGGGWICQCWRSRGGNCSSAGPCSRRSRGWSIPRFRS